MNTIIQARQSSRSTKKVFCLPWCLNYVTIHWMARKMAAWL
ncbi:hypothetical protein [Nitrosomonas ureae]|nr:hypothetical protein [Nitrosomonas ureae]